MSCAQRGVENIVANRNRVAVTIRNHGDAPVPDGPVYDGCQRCSRYIGGRDRSEIAVAYYRPVAADSCTQMPNNTGSAPET